MCGLVGVYNGQDAARLAYLGIYALQHRGEESAGIVSTDGQEMHIHKGLGLIQDAVPEEALTQLPGPHAIGHTRYSTTGSTLLKNSQPLAIDCALGSLAIAHNGNLTNTCQLRRELEAQGSIFQTSVDSEIILHLLAQPGYRTIEEALVATVQRIEGAFSLVLLTKEQLIGVRDPHGFRPLWLGQTHSGWILASETCALDLLQAKRIREIEPGEIVVIDGRGVRSIKPFEGTTKTPSVCIFEHVYFARPDSTIFGDSVHLVRQRLGRELAIEHPVEADLVMPIPDSGISAALGYSHQSGIPFEFGMIRNHYVGRTFIQPSQHIRDFQVKVKFNPIRELLQGKRVVVVDDSIVRGTTCKRRIQALREAGAKEIHMRISCPPIRHPCFFGIDFPTRGELIAATHSVEDIRKFLGADTLGYLSLEGLLRAVSALPKGQYCTACFSGKYPMPVADEGDKFVLEQPLKTSGVGPEAAPSG